jgi:hypothetical protein
MHALALALVMTLAADDGEVLSGEDPAARRRPAHPVPAWAPRDVSLGITLNSPLASAQLRLGWQITFYERGGHDLVVTAVLGTGLALALPLGMTAHLQHVALVGLGYRKVGKVISWGFQWGIGANWYSASFAAAAAESRVVPFTEGRAQLGVRARDHLVLGVFAGYGSPVRFDARFPGLTYTGGLSIGLFVDWR